MVLKQEGKPRTFVGVTNNKNISKSSHIPLTNLLNSTEH